VSTRRLLTGVVASAAAVAAVTGAVYAFRSSVPVLSLGVLYLFAVLPIAVFFGRAFAVAVALASMLAFNFFFLPPVHTFTLLDRRDWLALVVYLVVALVVSDLASRARRRAGEAEQRGREEALLAALSVALLQGGRIEDELGRVEESTASVLGVPAVRIELGEPSAGGPSVLALRAAGRTVGALRIEDGAPDPVARDRFLPALASLLAVAVERDRLEREAIEAERLRLSDQVKTAILRAVSHDLRSPLTAIRVAAESLSSPSVTLSDDDRKRQLETVRHESARLDRLVANLLDLSRLQTGYSEPRREVVSAEELVAQALAELGWDERIRTELPPAPLLLEVDSAQVERALVNLLENALRFSPPESSVLVRVAAEDGEAVLAVLDRGPGIPPGDADRIFEPFQQLASDDGGRRAGRGTGLGLAIVRGFAEANGGRAWAEPGPGGGASFAVAFPLVPSPAGVER